MNAQNTVKTLVGLSLNKDGLPDASRVGAVCAYVSAKFPPAAALKILRLYKGKIANSEFANTAKIASAGKLDEASKSALEAFAKSKNTHAQIEFINDENLIAGVKVSVGDTVWENSVRMKLEELRQSLGA